MVNLHQVMRVKRFLKALTHSLLIFFRSPTSSREWTLNTSRPRIIRMVITWNNTTTDHPTMNSPPINPCFTTSTPQQQTNIRNNTNRPTTWTCTNTKTNRSTSRTCLWRIIITRRRPVTCGAARAANACHRRRAPSTTLTIPINSRSTRSESMWRRTDTTATPRIKRMFGGCTGGRRCRETTATMSWMRTLTSTASTTYRSTARACSSWRTTWTTTTRRGTSSVASAPAASPHRRIITSATATRTWTTFERSDRARRCHRRRRTVARFHPNGRITWLTRKTISVS